MSTNTTATAEVSNLAAAPHSLSSRHATRNSLWWDAFRRLRRNKLAMVSLFVIIFYITLAVLSKAGVIFTNVAITDNANSYQDFSWEHPFGTDVFGRDVLARGVHGIATALSIGLLSSILSLVVGIVLGALAGYFGKRTDAVITWVYTTIDSVPYILLIPAFTFVLGRGLINAFIAVGLTSWVTTCRLIRAEFLKHKERDYVMAASALGASHPRKIFQHILPNVLHLAFVQFGLVFVAAIKIEVILSYLGLGVEASVPSWGIMLDDAKLEISRPFWGNLAAATLLMYGLILSFNLFNDGLREAFDPKLKNK